MSTGWQPSYITEKRLPSYVSDMPSYAGDQTDRLSYGAALYATLKSSPITTDGCDFINKDGETYQP